jgi:DNA repair protein RadC
MTKQLKEATKILGCQLLDSLIITELGYYSLADEGKS